ncbi:MAG: type III polyketide synthase [Alphaproteobacteria bacterium]
MLSINGLSSAFPKNRVYQEDIKDIGRKLFSSKINFKKMEKVYDNSGVKTRYLTEQLNWYLNEHNWSERNYLFKKNAVSLLKKSIEETILKTNTTPEKIGGIILVNSTGISTPSIDAEIFNLFNFNNEIVRLPIFGYGCAGGVLGLNRAVEIFKSVRKSILVCNVELCSLTFRPQIFSKENIVSTALFGDGCVSYLVEEGGDCNLLESKEYTWKNSLSLMGWGVEDDGLSVIFDKIIPEFITKRLPYVLSNFPLKNLNGYVLHSGGMRIIEAYKKILNNNKTIQESEEILSNFGNVSSVSVLLVLMQMIKKKYSGTFLMSALGPGFTAGLSGVKIGSNG